MAAEREREVLRYFARLGFIAFGGPAAHIALMRRELVQQRGWISDGEFMDVLGAANLIPGPNSTELTMHIGALRAGPRGLWIAGFAFILPAITIVLGLAWAYVRWGTTAAGEALLWGVHPLILAVVLQAIWGLRTAALRTRASIVIAAVVAAGAIAGFNELILLLGGGAALLAFRLGPGRTRALIQRASRRAPLLIPPVAPWALTGLAAPAAAVTPAAVSRLELFLIFLKVGGLLYGSGYVLVSFMQADLVDARGWLTHQQLLDAIAAGQFTPGPLFSSATFAGYVIDGFAGAALATAGIFLPSFVLVAATHRFVPLLRRSSWAAPFLDGVNAASIALMAVVTISLARDALDTPVAILLFAGGVAWLLRWNPNTAWLVVAGLIAGLCRWAITG